jgi:type I restriction enzyme M protein
MYRESGTGDRLITRAEVASLAGVSRPAVTNWGRRHPDFPRPVRSGEAEYFRLAGVLAWLDSHTISARSRSADEPTGITYGDRARRKMGLASCPEDGAIDRSDSATELSRGRNQGRLEELMGPLAVRVRGSAAMVDYITFLISLNFLRTGEPYRWSTIWRKVESGTERERTLLQCIGQSTDEALRERGIVPGLRESLVRLEPRTFDDLKRAIRLAGGLGRDAFRLLLKQYETQLHLRSGEFFTPRGLADLMADLVVSTNTEIRQIYDPYVRGGELLAAVIETAGSAVEVSRLTVCGESPRRDTLRLAGMNLGLHGVHGKFATGTSTPWNGGHRTRADLVLVNPPFNVGDSIAKERDEGIWPYGSPPAGNDNFAWIQHVLASLDVGGRAAVVMPNNAGNSANQAECKIRMNLVESGVVECVIALPPQLFTTTAIPVSVWLLRHPTDSFEHVLFIDARRRGTRARGSRALMKEDREPIVEVVRSWRAVGKSGLAPRDRDGFSVAVTIDAVRARDFSLNPIDYVSTVGQNPGTGSVLNNVAATREEIATLLSQAHDANTSTSAFSFEPSSEPSGHSWTLPVGWARYPLYELCEIQAGPSYTRLPATHRSREGQVPVVLPKHLRNGRIDSDDERVPCEIALKLKRFCLRAEDILCIRSGSIGPPALVTENQAGWVMSTNLLRLRRLRSDVVDPGYLLGYLSQRRVLEWTKDRATATAIPSISTQSLGELSVALPPLEVQRRISTMLQAFDVQASVHNRLAVAAADARTALMGYLMDGVLSLK